MKTLTVRLPEKVVAEIEAESRARKVSKSDVVRERLQSPGYQVRDKGHRPTFRDVAGDLIGSVKNDGLPRDLSARKKHYLRKWGYGKNRDR
jgi:Arc/MetJ-type ribon-helix-helix transcriptional regulator